MSGALFLSSTNAWSQAQRAMTIGELFSLVETGSNSSQVKKTAVDVAHQALSEAKSQRLPDVNTSLSVSYISRAWMKLF